MTSKNHGHLSGFGNLGLPGVERIPFVKGQTFGVEIELTRPNRRHLMNPRWFQIGGEIIDALNSKVTRRVHSDPVGYHENYTIGDPNRWYVTHDRSTGYEVVSPVLVDQEGFIELERATQGLGELLENNRWGLRLDHRTGLHVTLATRLTEQQLCGLLKRIQRLEPGLFTLLAPWRLYRFNGRHYDLRRRNPHCIPLRERDCPVDYMDLLAHWDLHARKGFSVNLDKLFEWDLFDCNDLLEVRMHHGTTNFNEIALWICLWMALVDRSRRAWTGEGVSGPVFDGDHQLSSKEVSLEDLFQLLDCEGISISPQFVSLLRERRRALRRQWEQVLPHRVRSWKAAGWYRRSSGNQRRPNDNVIGDRD